MDLQIVVGGTKTSGVHAGPNEGGTTPTATVITHCNQGEQVQVQAADQGAQRWGRLNNISPSAFSGTLLALL